MACSNAVDSPLYSGLYWSGAQILIRRLEYNQNLNIGLIRRYSKPEPEPVPLYCTYSRYISILVREVLLRVMRGILDVLVSLRKMLSFCLVSILNEQSATRSSRRHYILAKVSGVTKAQKSGPRRKRR
jgi:hypothetical protein